jgi:hypothetical protein
MLGDRAKASTSSQLFRVPYLIHALSFFALGVERTSALKGVASFSLNAGLTLHILGRRSLTLSFLADHGRTWMLTFLVASHPPGVAAAGASTGIGRCQLLGHIHDFLVARSRTRVGSSEGQRNACHQDYVRCSHVASSRMRDYQFVTA